MKLILISTLVEVVVEVEVELGNKDHWTFYVQFQDRKNIFIF